MVLLLATLGQAADIQADLHLDTPTQLFRQGVGMDAANLEAGLPQLRAGGTNLAVEVLWPPRDTAWEPHVEKLLSRMEAEDKRLDAIALARSPAEARRIAGEGRIAVTYLLEGAHGVDVSGVEGLRKLQARGLSAVGLTWSFSNRFGGSSGDGGGGLTVDGEALVREAQAMGLMIDVSHASRQTTLDLCGISRAPLIASHSDAAAVNANPRNLSDAEIACIAKTGGVIGVNLHGPFLGKPAGVAKAADHADHLKKVGGAGCVALGSDYDGIISPPPDLKDASMLPALFAELKRRGWSDAELRGMRGENFLRAWDAALSAKVSVR